MCLTHLPASCMSRGAGSRHWGRGSNSYLKSDWRNPTLHDGGPRVNVMHRLQGFDPSELADRGLEDDESFDEDDRASGAALVSRTTPLVSPGGEQLLIERD